MTIPHAHDVREGEMDKLPEEEGRVREEEERLCLCNQNDDDDVGLNMIYS